MADFNSSHFYAVIMAGGGGTRLWPLSRQSKPKQMLRLFGDRTLFQVAVDRLSGVIPPERIYVVTIASQVGELRAQVPEIPEENFILEPMPRGTASVVGLAAIYLMTHDPDAIMAVLTADHFIGDVAEFQKVLKACCAQAEKGQLVTIGIPPTYAATGYGYLHRGEPVESASGFPVYHVAAFKEKPDEITARAMVSDGQHDWNSGMFFWRASRILEEMQGLMPDLYKGLTQIQAHFSLPGPDQITQQIWFSLKTETIDFGIMEKAAETVVIPSPGLRWSDVGSWESLFDVLPVDEQGNLTLHARRLDFNTSQTLVCGTVPDRLIVTMGLSKMIIVDTPDVLLVCDREDAQQLRRLVTYLKDNGYEIYL